MSAGVLRKGRVPELEIVRPFDPWRFFCLNLEEILNRTQDIREQAKKDDEASSRRSRISHRQFYVGCAAMSIVMQGHTVKDEVIKYATNTMPRPSGSERVCGEPRVIKGARRRATRQGGKLIIPGVVVIGEPQQDRATGAVTETLFPCGETCWPDLFNMQKHTRDTVDPDTLIITTRADNHLTKGQVQTTQEFHDFYTTVLDGGHPAEPPLFSRTSESWRGVVDYYDSLVPQNFDPLVSLLTRERAVEAARAAIQGFEQRPQLYAV